MQTEFKRQTLLKACALALVFSLAGCAGTGKAPEDIVTTRAQERIDYLLAEDFESAYAYFSPGHRSGVSVRDFQRQQYTKKVQWTGAKVNESECSNNSCKVRISVDYAIYGGLPGVSRMDSTRMIEEDWILVDGTWYFWPGN